MMGRMSEKSSGRAVLLVLVASMLFGTTGTAQELGPDGLDPLAVGAARVVLAGAVVALTAKEFDLLTLFMRHPGRAYTRTQLLEQVWGTSYAGYEHTVNSHINRLRLKIERDPAQPEHILTVWGVGYQFNDALVGANELAG